MYIAYIYALLRRDGSLFLPPLPNPLAVVEGVVHKLDKASTLDLPDWPTKVGLVKGGMAFWPAVMASLLFAVVLGLALHLLIFRPLRKAPPLAKVVASIGLLLYLPAVAIRRFSSQPYTVKPLPNYLTSQKLMRFPLGLSMGKDQFVVTVLVVVFTILLYLVYQVTRFGLATRAASENEKGAVVLGFSPELLAGANWVISTVITGLLGIFAASIQRTIEPAVLPALIIPALTAALLGGFRSFGWTTFAAFMLGLQYGLVQYLGIAHDWFPKSGTNPFPGVERLLPLGLIVLVLYLRGKSLPTRGAISVGRLPFSPTPPTWSIRYGAPVLAIGMAILGMFVFTPPFRLALSSTLIGIVICLSIVVLTGYVGQISLAQMSFAGVAAFLVAKLTLRGHIDLPLPGTSMNLFTIPSGPFPVPIITAALITTLVGSVVAIPALRVRGVNLAIVTLAFAIAMDKAIFANPSVYDASRGAVVKAPQIIAEPRDVQYEFLGLVAGDGKQPNPMTAIFCLIVAVLLCYAVANLRRSATGRRMLATRSNERAAAASGVNVAAMKVLGFAVSSFIAGIGGALIAYKSGNVTPDKFLYTQSLAFLAFAYLGGVSSVFGAICGGVLVTGGLGFRFFQNVLGIDPQFTLMLGGLGLIITAVQNPEGIAGQLRKTGTMLAMKRSGRQAVPPNSPPRSVDQSTGGP
jgi:branched-chain amino acid transport system permease protein